MSFPYGLGSKCSLAYCRSIRTQGVDDLDKPISFFKFPKDHPRCALWVEKCISTNLPTTDFDVLHKNHKLCSLHFEDRMFSNVHLRNRLSPTAVPTLFVQDPMLQILCENNSVFEFMQLNDSILLADDISAIADPRSRSTPGPSFIPDNFAMGSPVSTSTEIYEARAATQTSDYLSINTPRKVDLRKQLAVAILTLYDLKCNQCL